MQFRKTSSLRAEFGKTAFGLSLVKLLRSWRPIGTSRCDRLVCLGELLILEKIFGYLDKIEGSFKRLCVILVGTKIWQLFNDK